MASSVFWKFKSQKDESRVTFDGTTISVFDLKREIILASNLVSSASDFDLLILDPTTEQEYKDDNHQIARSTSVLAKRLPAARPGKGKAASYVAGIQPGTSSRSESSSTAAGANTWQPGAPMSKRFDGREEPALWKQDGAPQFRSEGTSAEEAASIAAMFQASQEVWDETQEKMAQFVFVPILLAVPSSYTNLFSTPVYSNRGGFRGGKPFNQGNRGPGEAGGGGFQRLESRPVPPGYICYRCGKKGHWIHDCPTNDDRDWDNRPRVKRTTGIPRSFLKTVEQPNDGPLGQGVMVTPDGGFVVAQPDFAAWQKQRARPKALTSAEIYAAPAPAAHSNLACPICERLTKNAVRTPCCRTTYCEECLQTHLLDHDFADEKRREEVGEVVRSMIEESRKESTKQEPAEDALPQSTPTNTIASTVSSATDISTPPPSNSIPTPDTSQQDLASLQAQFAQLSQMLTNHGLPQAARQQAQRQAMKINAEMQKIMMGGAGMGAGIGGGGGGMGGPMGGGMGGGNQGGPMGMGGGMGPGMGMGNMGGMGGNMGMGGGMMGNGMGMNMGMGNGMGVMPGMGMGMGGMPGMNGMGMGMMGGMGMNPMMQNNRMMGMNMGMGGPMMGGPGPMIGHNPMMGGGGPMMAGGGQNWTNPFANQQPGGNESAYQRLPVHNRRKKRDRPSDFVEVGGDQSKVPRYWE
ncbi:hypothetical protein FRC10_002543 [Ceratobasidium sp. 414]|nr:hypothetical protein FRC10_002543 [Ceratobasidium sp. 414]